MGSLLAKTIPFSSKASETTIVSGTISSIRERPDVDPRVLRGYVYNDGSNSITVKLYGSADGSSWSQIVSVAVPAKAKGVLGGAVPGGKNYYKITVTGSSEGRIELFEMSGAFDRA